MVTQRYNGQIAPWRPEATVVPIATMGRSEAYSVRMPTAELATFIAAN
jgi:hypothetical protein